MYTFEYHAKRFPANPSEYIAHGKTYVQIRMPENYTACAYLIGQWQTPKGVNMWQAQIILPLTFVFWANCSRVRQCSGLDGHCACAGENASEAKNRLASWVDSHNPQKTQQRPFNGLFGAFAASTGREGAPACGVASRPVEASLAGADRAVALAQKVLFGGGAAQRDVMVTRHFSLTSEKNSLIFKQS